MAPVLAWRRKGYAILLEKPMATNLDECEQIVACVKRHGNLFAVCHVLLYTEFTQKLKSLLRRRADRRSGQHAAPGAGRLVAPGAFVRPRQLAQRDGVGVHAAGEVLPRHRLDPPHHGPPLPAAWRVSAACGTSRRPNGPPARPTAAWIARSRKRAPIRPSGSISTSSGGIGSSTTASTVITDDHTPAGVDDGARGRPLRPLRLCLRQRRGRQPGGDVGFRRAGHGQFHDDRVHADHPPQDADLRHAGLHRHRQRAGSSIFDFVSEKTHRLSTRASPSIQPRRPAATAAATTS